MSKSKRRSYTDEFKAEAVKLVTDQGYSVAEAARNLGIHANLLRNWKQKCSARPTDLSHPDARIGPSEHVLILRIAWLPNS